MYTAVYTVRFYRWNVDTALYDISPPSVATLRTVKVPSSERQAIGFGDGTPDE